MQRRNLFCLVSVLAVVVVVVVAFALSTGWEPSPAFSQGGTPTPPGGTTFTVNTHGDGGNPTPDGTCDDGAGNCTLREAILEANYVAGADTINFSIGTGYGWVVLTSALPTITDPVTIDGGTQEAGDLGWVELNGDGTSGADGLYITAGDSTVRRLLIVDFDGDGIVLEGGGGNVIRSNFIGLDHHGPRANGGHGVRITDSAKNAVGVPPGGGNFISGNGGDGVHISGSGADGNLIQSNTIGLQLNGDPLGNGSHGVSISGNNNVVGGAAPECVPPPDPCWPEAPAARNYIAFNDGAGIYVEGSGNSIRANNIYDNVGLGIDVYPPGVSQPPHHLRGLNTAQWSAIWGGYVVVTGYIRNEAPNTPLVVEAFVSPTCDASGYGEGKEWRAGTDPPAFSTDEDGEVSAAGGFPSGSEVIGRFVTTTVSYPDGTTNEFGNCQPIQADWDGDNIEQAVDGIGGTQLNVWSDVFSDQHLPEHGGPALGTTFGDLNGTGPEGRNSCFVSVVDSPEGINVGAVCPDEIGPAKVWLCGDGSWISLPHGASTQVTCGSLANEVHFGPVTVGFGTITAKLPTAAKVKISDPDGGDYEIVNDSASPPILVGGLSVAPGETVTVQDTDSDGMVNAYETAHTCLDPDVDDAAEDPDSDDLSNLSEAELETDPCDSDTDNDGMPDGYEAGKTCLDALANDATSDPDRDGRNNITEYGLGSDPCSADAPVGGIAELPDLAPGGAQPSDAPPEGSGWSGGTYAAVAAGVAAAALALAGGAWYARRRWLKA
jgi:CSLREA domain-containing protein